MYEEGKTTIRVVSVTPTGAQTLRVQWTNGREFTVDLRELVFRLKGLRPLRDPGMFARASVGDGGLAVMWPGDIDMGAGRLWERALEQNGHADAAEFIRWRTRNGLSLTTAAEALGLSRRQVAYYCSGEERVPRTVLLACKGWEAEQRDAA